MNPIILLGGTFAVLISLAIYDVCQKKHSKSFCVLRVAFQDRKSVV